MTGLLGFAVETVCQAGQLLRELHGRQHTVGHKSSDIDLVTEADVAAERLIVDAIRARFPGHSVLSEEGLGDHGVTAADTPWLWLVDPLDGTVNYVHGYPTWGVSLALAQRGRLVLGVTCNPLRNEVFWSEQGRGAWLNGEPIRVSDVRSLADALVATGFAYQRASLDDNNLAEFAAVVPRVQGVRRAGAAVLDLAYLAAGRLDAYWEMHLEPWDWAAGWLLVREAGGVVTSISGDPWTLETGNVAASNGALHSELLSLLKPVRRTATPDSRVS